MRRGGTYRPMPPARMLELIEFVWQRDGDCFFKNIIDHKCDHRKEALHILPQSKLKSVYRNGAWRMPSDDDWRPLTLYTPRREGMVVITLEDACADARNAVAGCRTANNLFDGSQDIRKACLDYLPLDWVDFLHEFNVEPEAETWFGLEPWTLGGKGR